MKTFTRAQARRIALGAQGFTDPVPTGAITARHLNRVLNRIGMVQMDSVTVLQRAHYLPLYSRLGPYPTELLDRAAYRKPRLLFEYWGHAASLLPVELYPLMRWRMERDHSWGGVTRIAARHPHLVDWVRDEVRVNGPLTAAEIEADYPKPTGNWGWNWSDVKTVLEWLFWRGEVLVSTRNSGFARLYDRPERVLPPHIMAAPVPDDAEATRQLLAISARSLGIANEVELRDYFRLPVKAFKVAVADLIADGTIEPVAVEGSKGVSYVPAGVKIPRRVSAATLVSPFDPLLWHRGRTERIFEFFYRIEIYVPAELRVHGYYVLPFLLGEQLVARVDLKSDRQAGVLRVPGAWAEPSAPPHTASALAAELVRLAGWLGLARVERPQKGDLAGEVAIALTAHEDALSVAG
jgi:uncharacterized protein YcaQ